MSMAWEVTDDDIDNVLRAHGQLNAINSQQASDLVDNESDRVEKAVLYYTEMEEQADAANSEIEDILIENKLLSGPKKFNVS